ncbi:MAG: hypothetical protein WC273_02145 [Dehalococcoidia bacterium]
MTRTLTRLAARMDRGILPRLLVALAVVGLIAPSAAAYAGPDGAAWFPEHGHIFLSSAAAARPHAHPWDTHPAHAGTASGDSEVPSAGSGLVFTVSDLGTLSAVATVALPAHVLLPAVAWRTHTLEALRIAAFGRIPAPLVPPPQA